MERGLEGSSVITESVELIEGGCKPGSVLAVLLTALNLATPFLTGFGQICGCYAKNFHEGR